MSDRYSEIELKFEVGGSVTKKEFIAFGMGHHPKAFRGVSSPDVYWERDGIAIRHRYGSSGGPGELTVKRRKSADSSVDRFEIDLFFDPDRTTGADVEKFLKLSGWKKSFSLQKESLIFNYSSGACLAMYEVVSSSEPCSRTFIEIEAAKDSIVPGASDRRALERWQNSIELEWPWVKRVDRSLYEIYSGNPYLVYEE
jgi:hypothetical protein